METPKQKNYPKLKQLVKYMLKKSNGKKCCQILGEAGESVGQNKNWFNLRSSDDGILHSNNWDKVEIWEEQHR